MSSDSPRVRNLGALWTLLSDMRIEDPGATRSFEQALAEENGWAAGRARLVSGEYRRFLYLTTIADGEITPSVEVDKAWHLHLTYTRHYWDVLCGEILRRPLHHLPSAGGEVEDERHRRQYEVTLDLYRRTFGDSPPRSVWPRPAPEPEVEVASEGEPPRGLFLLCACAAAAIPAALASAAGSLVALGLVIALSLAALIHLIPPFAARASFSRRGRSSCGGCGEGGFGFWGGGDGGGDGCAGCGASCGGGCGGCGG